MNAIMMMADLGWLRYNQTHTIRNPVVFYGSPKRKTNNYDFLFCVHGHPLAIWAIGKIADQIEIHQNDAWAKYTTSLGANTELEWREQAAKVLNNSTLHYNGLILAIELTEFVVFPQPVSLGEAGIPYTGFQLMKGVSESATSNVVARLSNALSPEQIIRTAPPAVENIVGESKPVVFPPLNVKDPPKVSERASLEAPSEIPGRETIQLERIIRDTRISKEVKELYKYRCQLCNYRVEFDNGQFYAEGHHIKPLGSPHNGPDTRDNVLCVCPNCHAKLDYGAILLDPQKINNDQDEHPIRKEYIDYHNSQIYNGRHLTSRSS